MTSLAKTRQLRTKIKFRFLAIIIRNDIKNSRAKFHNDMKLSCQVIREYVYNTLLNKLPNYGFNTIRMLLVGTNRSQTVRQSVDY